ncbi:MAG: recombinase family protein [Syntrophomonadaceae bacterium]|jgi:site-specific DNA recombinase|nr:recombinase family protein [Syntrophomonadaceae bacterium]
MTEPNTVKRVALYTRVSTREQAQEGFSLEAQERTLREYCTLKGWEIVRTYSDKGKSAKDIKRRSDMLRLLEDVKKKEFDIVLVWKLTRATRSLTDLCKICEVFEKYGAGLVSSTEAFDTVTSTGRMILHILGVIAQFELEVISENVKLGLSERVMQGLPTMTYTLGYDRCGEDISINQKEAKIVEFIYSYYLECQNISEVSRSCIAKGYRGKRGGVLTPNSVTVILTSFSYCGYNSFNRQPYKGQHEAIISAETYNRVQQLLDARLGRRKRIYPLVLLP